MKFTYGTERTPSGVRVYIRKMGMTERKRFFLGNSPRVEEKAKQWGRELATYLNGNF